MFGGGQLEQPCRVAGPDGGAGRQHELGQLRLLADADGRRQVPGIQPGAGQVDGRRGLEGSILFPSPAPRSSDSGFAASCKSSRMASNGSNARGARANAATIDGYWPVRRSRADGPSRARVNRRRGAGTASGAAKSRHRSRSTIRDQWAKPPTHSTDTCWAIKAASADAIAASRTRSLTRGCLQTVQRLSRSEEALAWPPGKLAAEGERRRRTLLRPARTHPRR